MDKEKRSEIIKKARKEKSLKKIQVARMIGIPASTYNMYEDKGCIPRDSEVIKRLVSVLGIPITEYLPGFHITEENEFHPLANQLAKEIRDLSDPIFKKAKEFNSTVAVDSILYSDLKESISREIRTFERIFDDISKYTKGGSG